MKRPGKVVCVGRNYREHARELGNEIPPEPLIFLKPPSSVIGSGEPIVLPSLSERVEYEGEIGIVLRSTLRHASQVEARRAIRGVCAVNDVTARDLQKKDSQWTRAKGFDTFCPIGECHDLSDGDVLDGLEVITALNGSERQRGMAAQMAFSIPMLLAYISRIMTLESGDVIATGTPAGVGPLSPGDVVEVCISGKSSVSNPVIAEG
ncbi:MAG TPA: fumarylacetoacetate hydrolase family protein [Gemmatimonadaceae bacterium]|nr:fumarylacetoacetate hydrolase family protein [Gemmatimonadaceae bacterium]